MQYFKDGQVNYKITFTTKCSAACTTCLNSKISQHSQLDRILFERLINEIIDLDIASANTVGFYSIGESWLHPDFVSMCEWAIPKLHSAGIKTEVVTNGSHIDKIPEGIGSVYISFNAGKKDSYEKITKMSFDKVYNNIMRLYESGELKKAKDVQIHMLCFDDNKGEEEEFIELFKKLKGVRYRFSYKYDNQYESTEHKGREEQYNSMRHKVPCSYVVNGVTIYPNGDVVRCSHDFFDEYAYGNLYKDSLKQILMSEKRLKTVKEHFDGVYNEICEKCDFNMKSSGIDFVYGMFDKEENQFYQENGHNHYAQLKHNENRLLQELPEGKKILLWGRGKRGQAFEKWCVEKNILIETYDQKEDKVDILNDLLNKMDIVVVSNSAIYTEMRSRSMFSGKVIDLAEYCHV